MDKPLRPGRLSLLAAIVSIMIILPVTAASASPAAAGRAVTSSTRHSSGPSGFYFQNRYNGRCLDVPGQSTTIGQDLQQYTCNFTAAQIFNQVQDSSGYDQIINVQNGLCVANTGGWA